MTDKNEQYEYIGPDGEIVNRDIKSDRALTGTIMNHVRPADETLQARANIRVINRWTAQEVVRSIGNLEARNAEGRNK